MDLKQVKILREKYHLTQYDICRYVGVSDVSYRTWEHRVRKPRTEHIEKLRDIFNILKKHESEIISREVAIDLLDKEFLDA